MKQKSMLRTDGSMKFKDITGWQAIDDPSTNSIYIMAHGRRVDILDIEEVFRQWAEENHKKYSDYEVDTSDGTITLSDSKGNTIDTVNIDGLVDGWKDWMAKNVGTFNPLPRSELYG